ncbi:hypothetical protein BGX38DRAFT_709043 [Terfezia claveryi]|nr:hypothetical protein BGX38DRAFT_709043 [Terfezia claveryi]
MLPRRRVFTRHSRHSHKPQATINCTSWVGFVRYLQQSPHHNCHQMRAVARYGNRTSPAPNTLPYTRCKRGCLRAWQNGKNDKKICFKELWRSHADGCYWSAGDIILPYKQLGTHPLPVCSVLPAQGMLCYHTNQIKHLQHDGRLRHLPKKVS